MNHPIHKIKVNDFKIIVPEVEHINRPPFIKGVISKPTPCIGGIGKRGGGKTTINYNLIKQWLRERIVEKLMKMPSIKKEDKKRKEIDWEKQDDDIFNIKVLIFASTVNQDPLYKDLLKKLKVRVPKNKEKREMVATWEPDRNQWKMSKISLAMLMLHPEMYGDDDETEEIEIDNPWIHGYEDLSNLPDIENHVKETKDTVQYLCVFDDISLLLKYDPKMAFLVKNFRHYGGLLITSQWIHDFPPDIRQNLGYVFLLRKISEKKLKLLWDELSMDIPWPVFKALYDDATGANLTKDESIGKFLFIDVDEDEFRSQLDEKYDISAYQQPRKTS